VSTALHPFSSRSRTLVAEYTGVCSFDDFGQEPDEPMEEDAFVSALSSTSPPS
jgi:hypothetical protein